MSENQERSGPLERAELANRFKDLGFWTTEMLQKKKVLIF